MRKSYIIRYVFCILLIQTQRTESKESVPEQKSRWDEINASHQAYMNASRLKRDKFSSVLNQLKNALAEEIQNSDIIIKEDDNIFTVRNTNEEKTAYENNETQIEKPNLQNEEVENDIVSYQNVENTISSPISGSQNASNDQIEIEMPTLIPIFKPRPQPSQPNKNSLDIRSQIPGNSPTRQNPKTRAVSFVPEKIVQTNMSPMPRTTVFDIPCQRASDVLDMNIGLPKDVCNNINPITNIINTKVQNQVPSPVKISCADEDNTVAMLFKPKNISLKQVYGNLLKKITITVLVPYHMSKLGAK